MKCLIDVERLRKEVRLLTRSLSIKTRSDIFERDFALGVLDDDDGETQLMLNLKNMQFEWR